MNRLPSRLAIACAVATGVAGGVGFIVRKSRASELGRSTVVLPMTSSSRSGNVDPKGMTIGTRFRPPIGYVRLAAAPGSYAEWLRSLTLKPDGSPVRLFDGRLKTRQDVHAAVLDLEPGPRDLQQCADAAIRLRAQYLHGSGRMDDIAFHFTSGFACGFREWRSGRRVSVEGNDVAWRSGGDPDSSATALRKYLDVVFTYAGTASLPRDVDRVGAPHLPEPGDLYLHPGSPGHAMTVVDVAERGGARVILLAQSYMPAQEIHVVRNPESDDGDPWIRVGEGPVLATPEWRFGWDELRRFRDAP